jgi:hypothetical protein
VTFLPNLTNPYAQLPDHPTGRAGGTRTWSISTRPYRPRVPARRVRVREHRERAEAPGGVLGLVCRVIHRVRQMAAELPERARLDRLAVGFGVLV